MHRQTSRLGTMETEEIYMNQELKMQAAAFKDKKRGPQPVKKVRHLGGRGRWGEVKRERSRAESGGQRVPSPTQNMRVSMYHPNVHTHPLHLLKMKIFPSPLLLFTPRNLLLTGFGEPNLSLPQSSHQVSTTPPTDMPTGANDPAYENITLTFRNRDQSKSSHSPPKNKGK